jgi:predicted  nucleic acid-binding Zn-ribbon protein
VKELNKAIQDLKVELEIIKKTQMEANLEMKNLGKSSRVTYVSIINKIQEIEERNISCRRYWTNIMQTLREHKFQPWL